MSNCPTCRYYGDCMKCLQDMPKSVCGNYQQNRAKPKKPSKEATICWSCVKLDCSWMQSLEPVAGWDAEKTYYTDKVHRKSKCWSSYCVKSCPGYVAGKDAENKRKNKKGD